MYDDIYYLVHVTSTDPRTWSEKFIRTSPYNKYEFPGAYFTLVHKYNFDEVEIGGNQQNNYIIIISKEILKQKNYHYNIRDYNGFIHETNTYFPWNLDKGIKVKTKFRENEIVFHDPVSLEYAIDIYKFVKGPEDYLFYPEKYKDVKVPKANLSFLPFYAFCFEDFYTGYEPLPKSSYAFYQKMALLVNMKEIPKNSNAIVDSILEIAPWIHKHRYFQNLKALKPKPFFFNPFEIFKIRI